ncbi:hypothetical protein ACROYT_G037893 [Oculina patagonica]
MDYRISANIITVRKKFLSKTESHGPAHKQRNLVWTKGTDALEGELQSSSEVDFYIDQDMIHIADIEVERRYGDFFIRQVHKFDEVTKSIQAMQ